MTTYLQTEVSPSSPARSICKGFSFSLLFLFQRRSTRRSGDGILCNLRSGQPTPCLLCKSVSGFCRSPKSLVAEALNRRTKSEGDVILDLSNMPNQTLKLGPGRRQDGDAIFVMNAGRLRFSKPNKCWVESSEKRVVWGKISMVDAEKRLLANALHDTDNQHFILLSDSCVPLHNFDYVYNYLMDTNVSFIDSFEDPGPHGTGRYLDNMLPEIEKKDWRKGAQGHEERFSIYVHASREKPKHVSPLFIDRDIHSKQVVWGKISMVDAEKRLLANALQDTDNQHFILLSDSCVPLHNFDYV